MLHQTESEASLALAPRSAGLSRRPLVALSESSHQQAVRLYWLNPVTPAIPKVLNSQPPRTAPTMPSTMSNITPSPVLLMSLLR